MRNLTNILGVASSVSADNGFDTLDAIKYAIDNEFEGFQAFINGQLVSDKDLRMRVHTLCKDQHLNLKVDPIVKTVFG